MAKKESCNSLTKKGISLLNKINARKERSAELGFGPDVVTKRLIKQFNRLEKKITKKGC